MFMARNKDANPLWSCDIQPFVDELANRFTEAQKSGATVLNLSYTHANGFFPTAITHREPIRTILRDAVSKGWSIDRTIGPAKPYPDNIWMPKGMRRGKIDLLTCDLLPFIKELDRREEEAKLDAEAMTIRKGKSVLAVVDLTAFCSEGTFPPAIWDRIKRRRDRSWVKETQSQIDKLEGQANKDEAFAHTQLDRMESVEDPTKLKASADELVARAASLRVQANFLKRELVGV
jgi:hypothetical protein